MRTAIVTAADANFLHVMEGLLASLRQYRPDDRCDICVLDVGLTSEQLKTLACEGHTVAKARWDFSFPLQAQTPRRFQAMFARPSLRSYFPNYDLYVWLDADTWLQDWRAVELLIEGAKSGSMAIVPELHRMYPYVYGAGDHPKRVYQWYESAFGTEVARVMAAKPILNGGAFALQHDSRVWSAYDKWLRIGAQKSPHHWMEQCALNLALYVDVTQFYPLPAYCNWICSHALPMWDPARKCLCEPIQPYEQISLVHITGCNAPSYPLSVVGGQTAHLPLGYHAIKTAASASLGSSFAT